MVASCVKLSLFSPVTLELCEMENVCHGSQRCVRDSFGENVSRILR